MIQHLQEGMLALLHDTIVEWDDGPCDCGCSKDPRTQAKRRLLEKPKPSAPKAESAAAALLTILDEARPRIKRRIKMFRRLRRVRPTRPARSEKIKKSVRAYRAIRTGPSHNRHR